MTKKHEAEVYYDLNIMIWKDETGEFGYSVIQEFDEHGQDNEVLVSGFADSVAEALDVIRDTALTVLSDS